MDCRKIQNCFSCEKKGCNWTKDIFFPCRKSEDVDYVGYTDCYLASLHGLPLGLPWPTSVAPSTRTTTTEKFEVAACSPGGFNVYWLIAAIAVGIFLGAVVAILVVKRKSCRKLNCMLKNTNVSTGETNFGGSFQLDAGISGNGGEVAPPGLGEATSDVIIDPSLIDV